MEIEFVENALAFVDFAELFIKVFSDIQRLDRLLIVAHIPNVHGQIVT